MQTVQPVRARTGDAIEVSGHAVGESVRSGEILEVLGEPEHRHFRVRWEDGRETVFYPGSDARVRPRARRKPRS